MVKRIIKYISTIVGVMASILIGLTCLLLLLYFIPFKKTQEEQLFWAIQNNNSEEVKLLLENGADPNEYYFGPYPSIAGLPIGTAARDNKLEIVKLLLEYGADPNKEMLGGGRPINYAAFYGHSEVIDLLLKNGADPNISGNMKAPMIAAMVYGHVRVVKYLLEYGIDPNTHFSLIAAVEPNTQFPFIAEVDHCHSLGKNKNQPKIVQLLLEYGADPNMRDNQSNTPLHYAASHISESNDTESDCNLRIVQLLLEYGADQNARDRFGVTPIHAAAFSGKPEIMELLLKSDSTYNITYFSNAIKRRDKLEIVRLLLKQGISPQIKAAGIYFAIHSHELEILELLLKQGADPNMEYREVTPIFFAVKHQFYPEIKLLVKYGVNLSAQTKAWIEKYVQ